jgi:hypothetical protein
MIQVTKIEILKKIAFCIRLKLNSFESLLSVLLLITIPARIDNAIKSEQYLLLIICLLIFVSHDDLLKFGKRHTINTEQVSPEPVQKT